MKISSIKFLPLTIPFVSEFTHTNKKRAASDTFLVKISSSQGLSGFGEGLVREYVTGETLESTRNALASIASEICRLTWQIDTAKEDPIAALSGVAENLDEILEPIENDQALKVIRCNGLRCALELAILDTLMTRDAQSLGQILPAKVNKVTYSAVVSADSHDKALKTIRHFKKLGFQDYKVKVTSLEDQKLIRMAREIIGPKATLRLDANSAFSVTSAIEFLDSVRDQNIAAIEQPVPRGPVEELATIQKTSPTPVMPDESLIDFKDAAEIIEKGAAGILNIRLAKCGGIFKSLQIAQLAAEHHLPVQLGCLVGESGLLSAVGRHVAAFLPNCKFVEGSFGNLLLKEDVTKQSVKFGYGGQAPLIKGKSFGVDVNERTVAKYNIESLAEDFPCPS